MSKGVHLSEVGSDFEEVFSGIFFKEEETIEEDGDGDKGDESESEVEGKGDGEDEDNEEGIAEDGGEGRDEEFIEGLDVMDDACDELSDLIFDKELMGLFEDMAEEVSSEVLDNFLSEGIGLKDLEVTGEEVKGIEEEECESDVSELELELEEREVKVLILDHIDGEFDTEGDESEQGFGGNEDGDGKDE